jgi:hypothetical protein
MSVNASEPVSRTFPPFSPKASNPDTNLARETLEHIFADPQAGWSRIHAAEALSAVGFADDIRARLLAALPEWERSPQRIGAWRVLAATSRDSAERQKWIDRVEGVSRDATAPDRLQAVESLGKLACVASAATIGSAREYAFLLSAAEALFPLWALTVAGDQAAAAQLRSALSHSDAQVRRRAGYIIRRLPSPSAELRDALVKQAAQEPPDTAARPYLLTAVITLDLEPERHSAWLSELERLWPKAAGPIRLEISHALRKLPTPEMLGVWRDNLRESDIGTRVAAAWAILEISSRSNRGSKQ